MVDCDVTMDFRKYLLKQPIKAGEVRTSWKLAPGVWREARALPRWAVKRITVWGDAGNRLLCHPFPVPAGADAEDVKSTRELARNKGWAFARRLKASDLLPGAYGPDVAAYLARVEGNDDGGAK